MWSSRQMQGLDGIVAALPQQPGQLMQNAMFTKQKEYATWNQNIPPNRPRSRETELMDILLIDRAIKKPISLPQINQQKSVSPDLSNVPNFYIPIHPQHQSFSPYPLPQGYPQNFISPQHSQLFQQQQFPSSSVMYEQQLKPYPLSNPLKSQSEAYSYIKNSIAKQNEYQTRLDKEKFQLKLAEESLLKSKSQRQNLQDSRFLSDRHPKKRNFQMVPPIIIEPPRVISPIKSKMTKKEKLVLQLTMIKEIQEINRIKKNIPDSDSQISSEPSVEYVQKERRRVLKPVPKPKYIDILVDEETLKNLQKQRGLRNCKRFLRKFSYFIYKLNDIKQFNKIKKEKALNLTPQLQNDFKNEMVAFSSAVSEAVLDQVIKQKYNLRIVETPQKKLTVSQLRNNTTQLKTAILLTIQKMMQTPLSKKCLEYLIKITSNNEYLLQGVHVIFELNRLSYSLVGTLKEMTPGKQKMMLMVNLWIKHFLLMGFPETQKSIQQISEIMITNIKTLTSALYEIVLQFCKGQALPVANNTKSLAIEVITKERTENFYPIKHFQETQDEITFLALCQQQKSDEPLLHPLFTAREMEKFFDAERKFVGEALQQLDGWCMGILTQIDELRQQQKEEKMNEKKKQLNDLVTKVLEPKKKNIQQCVKDNKANYQKLCSDIKAIKLKIQQDKEKNEQMKKEYEEQEKARQARQDQLNKLGS